MEAEMNQPKWGEGEKKRGDDSCIKYGLEKHGPRYGLVLF